MHSPFLHDRMTLESLGKLVPNFFLLPIVVKTRQPSHAFSLIQFPTDGRTRNGSSDTAIGRIHVAVFPIQDSADDAVREDRIFGAVHHSGNLSVIRLTWIGDSDTTRVGGKLFYIVDT